MMKFNEKSKSILIPVKNNVAIVHTKCFKMPSPCRLKEPRFTLSKDRFKTPYNIKSSRKLIEFSPPSHVSKDSNFSPKTLFKVIINPVSKNPHTLSNILHSHTCPKEAEANTALPFGRKSSTTTITTQNNSNLN